MFVFALSIVALAGEPSCPAPPCDVFERQRDAVTARSGPLRLDDVLRAVRQTHPDLEAAAHSLEQARAKAFAARGGFDPVLNVRGKWNPIGYYQNGQVDATIEQPTPLWGISAFAGYRLSWGSFPVYKGEDVTLSAGEVRGGINIPVWRGGPIDERRAAIREADLRREIAELERASAYISLEQRATIAYWAWVAAGLNLQIAEHLLDVARQREEALREQAEQGSIARIAVTDNRRLVLDRQSKLVATKQKFLDATLELSLFLRDGERQPIRVSRHALPAELPLGAAPPRGSVEADVQRALAARPDLQRIALERQVADVRLRLAKNEVGPDVDVQTFVAKDFGEGSEIYRPIELGVGMTVSMPLGLRRVRGTLRAAKAELAAIKARERGLRDKIEADVRNAWVDVEAAHERVQLASEQAELAEQLAEAERERLAEGVSDLVVVNLRELAAADAAVERVEALARYEQALADLRAATGTTGGDL